MAAIPDTVKPGDIISSDLFNRIIALLNAHDVLLVSTTTPTTGLAVNQLIPAGPYRIGDTVQIFGQNFQFRIGAVRVFLNATQVINIVPTSSDTRLEFAIPPVPGVNEEGTSVELVVLNRTESVTRSIVLRPQLIALQGSVLVNWLGVEPATVTAGQPATFRYRIESRANARATWLIAPDIDVATNAPAWNAAVRVLDSFGSELPSRQIVDLVAGESRNFSVRLAPVPAGTSGASFGLSVTATAGGISGLSGVQPFVVGTPAAPPDPTFTASLIPDFSSGALSGSTLTVPGGQNRQVAIDLALTAAGDYSVTRPISAGTTGWTASVFIGTVETFTVTAAELAATGNTTRRLRYVIAAAAGATASGGQIQFAIQRTGQTLLNAVSVNLVRS